MKTIKSVRQSYLPDLHILNLLETFRDMVNFCITIGLQNDTHALKRLSVLSYRQLAQYNILSYYKLCAISKASGILWNDPEISIKWPTDKPVMISKDEQLPTLKNADNNFVYH